ncbi:MAG TPA: cation diffusion facilitator family transporter [Nocardioidaceae bacterium]|jgi:cobalt-zinc-cadmium efflux system protein|nr:cation diffusion facilitator family transporter [Nocardioidaceae bacterium]
MGTGHAHGHAEGRAVDRSRLAMVLAITLAVVGVELVGAWVSGSLALLADAGHLVTDAASVAVALSASYVATLPPTSRRTFGLHRVEILAALVNAVVLLGVCGYLAVEGVRRLVHPATVQAGPMLVFALVGLVANAVSLMLLTTRKDESLNMRGAYLEVLGDLVGSGLVVLAAAVIMTTGATRADPVASLLIAVLILPRCVGLLRDAVAVLLETTPAHLDLDDVRDHLLEVPGVVDVHDLHAWTITSGMPSLSAHVTVTDGCLDRRGVGPLLDEFSGCVAAHFSVDHVTFQIEPVSHRAHEHLGEAHA